MDTRRITPGNSLSGSDVEVMVKYLRSLFVLEQEVPEDVQSVRRSALEHQQNTG